MVLLVVSVALPSSTSLPCSLPSNKQASWVDVGPAGWTSLDGTAVASSGAGQAAVHLNGTTWLYATANGGIWKTADILRAPEPSWRQMLDDQPVACTSISAMGAKGQTVLAGCGSATSSEMGTRWDVANAGDWAGVLISRDGGESWEHTAFPANFYISGVLVLSPDRLVVSAVSHMYDRFGGGVWTSSDGGKSFRQTLTKPIFDLKAIESSGTLLAAPVWAAPDEALFASADGESWRPVASGLSFAGRKPFYPNVALGHAVLFFGALTVDPANYSDTASVLFSRPLASLLAELHGEEAAAGGGGAAGAAWAPVANAPRLDEDGMQKDRMALLVHPADDDLLFVAGNAGALTWRVAWRQGAWVESAWGDTADHTGPHSDCRNYYWEPTGSNLILLSDGGAFLRTQPTAKGGVWRGLQGDIGAMELVSASYDPTTRSWVGGAQDNSVQLAGPNASAATRAVAIVGGDGTFTAVDTHSAPARFYGTSQFYGNFDDDDAGPHRRRRLRRRRLARTVEDKEGDTEDEEEEDEDEKGQEEQEDDDDVTFGYASFGGGGKVGVTGVAAVQDRKFFDIDQFPFFDQPAALNGAAATADGSPLVIWARGSKTRGTPSAFYTVANASAPPVLDVTTAGDVFLFVAGGVTAGTPDPSMLVGMNDTALLHRSSASAGLLTTSPLPTSFARPIEFSFWAPNSYVLGPVSHKRTVSLAVSPADSAMVAVSGWTSLESNAAAHEAVHLSLDRGATWADVTANLPNATGVCANRDRCGKWRPSALLLLPLPSQAGGGTALLVGTVAGVFATAVPAAKPPAAKPAATQWVRLGGCSQLPLVLIGGLSYEPTTDTVVAATMGRGVYLLPEASQAAMVALQA